MNSKESIELAEQLRRDMQPLLQGHSTLQDAFGLTSERVLQIASTAVGLASQGKLMDAGILFGGLTLVEPENGLLHSCLGSVLMQLKQNESAISELSYAVELNPSDIHAHANLGEVSCETGDLGRAVMHLEKAIQLDPSGKNPTANRARALLLLISNIARDLQNLRPEEQESLKNKFRSVK